MCHWLLVTVITIDELSNNCRWSIIIFISYYLLYELEVSSGGTRAQGRCLDDIIQIMDKYKILKPKYKIISD